MTHFTIICSPTPFRGGLGTSSGESVETSTVGTCTDYRGGGRGVGSTKYERRDEMFEEDIREQLSLAKIAVSMSSE